MDTDARTEKAGSLIDSVAERKRHNASARCQGRQAVQIVGEVEPPGKAAASAEENQEGLLTVI